MVKVLIVVKPSVMRKLRDLFLKRVGLEQQVEGLRMGEALQKELQSCVREKSSSKGFVPS